MNDTMKPTPGYYWALEVEAQNEEPSVVLVAPSLFVFEFGNDKGRPLSQYVLFDKIPVPFPAKDPHPRSLQYFERD